jgi:hypothetical protein
MIHQFKNRELALMKRYFIACLLVLAVVVAGCSSSSDFTDNGSLAVTAGSTTLTPGGGTSISAKYTITTKVQIALAGNDTNFFSSRPDLVVFNPATVQSDSTGGATTGLTVLSTSQVPTGGVDVVVTASFRGLSSNVIIHVNPVAGGSASLSLTTPSSANLGSSFSVTAAITPAPLGKVVTFSSNNPSNNPDLIIFYQQSNITDGTGTATTIVSVKPTPTTPIPPAGVDVAFFVTDGVISAMKIVHINSPASGSNTIKLIVPALANMGSNFAVSAVLSPVTAGTKITFSSKNLAFSFDPNPATIDGSGTAKSTVTLSYTAVVPQNGLDETLTATEVGGTVSDLQLVHVNGSAPAEFSIFPSSLDISNIPIPPDPQADPIKMQVVVTPTPGSYNFSAKSRAPFIIDVDSAAPNTSGVNITNGEIKLSTRATGKCGGLITSHTGTVLIEIKDNTLGNPGATLFYPVTYSLCW